MAGVGEGGRGEERTRLAPSPTGALHLGNVRTFLINWALARRRGWRVLMRVEDLDTPRTKAGAAVEALGLLEWLGVDWDEGPVFQSAELSGGCGGAYGEAMGRLASLGLVYPCSLTRREIEAAASAPHRSEGGGAGDGESRYPSSLRMSGCDRPRAFEGREGENWRFVVREGGVVLEDGFRGEVSLDPSASVGDFVVWTKRGEPSYQLAVTVDDARHGVTRVVRGDDLLDSAGRQLLLYEALGLRAPGWFCHVPLVVGGDGRRLAKRHGDTRLARYKEEGVRPERVVGLVAHLSGFAGGPRELSAAEFAAGFDLSRLPAGAVVFGEEEEAWLV